MDKWAWPVDNFGYVKLGSVEGERSADDECDASEGESEGLPAEATTRLLLCSGVEFSAVFPLRGSPGKEG